jgi:prepilin-type processing-associated H-X9-DG protein
LLETVFTITIIGILLAIFLPVVSAIKLSAQKVRDVANLQKIVETWRVYTEKFGIIPVCSGGFVLPHSLSGGTKVTGWAEERCLLNDPYVYVSSGDKYASKIVKDFIKASPPFGRSYDGYCKTYDETPNALILPPEGISLSYCLISGLPTSIPLNTTPLGFTRGLKANGTWHSKYGLYGDKGGYVVFCDGHVTWFDGSRPTKFLKWDQSGYTSDIREAIPLDALIDGGYHLNTNIKDIDDSLLLIYHYGTGND